MKIYRLRNDTRVLALRGLRETALFAAQAAVVVGGAAPRAVVRELEMLLEQLRDAGWHRLKRQEVVAQATMHER